MLLNKIMKKAQSLFRLAYNYADRLFKNSFIFTTVTGSSSFLEKVFIIQAYLSVNTVYYTVTYKIGFAFFMFAIIYGFLGARGELHVSQWVCYFYASYIIGLTIVVWLIFLNGKCRDFLYRKIGKEYITSRIGNSGSRPVLVVTAGTVVTALVDTYARDSNCDKGMEALRNLEQTSTMRGDSNLEKYHENRHIIVRDFEGRERASRLRHNYKQYTAQQDRINSEISSQRAVLQSQNVRNFTTPLTQVVDAIKGGTTRNAAVEITRDVCAAVADLFRGRRGGGGGASAFMASAEEKDFTHYAFCLQNVWWVDLLDTWADRYIIETERKWCQFKSFLNLSGEGEK